MPTTNPVPSQDPSDLLFNAGKLDEVVNGAAAYYTDRLGVNHRTIDGINAAADVVLSGLGYAPPVAYAAGISLTLATQTVEYSGEVYAPKVANLPFTTSGTFETAKFRLIQGVASTDLPALVGQDLQDYAALRSYTGSAKRVYITGLLITAKPAGISGVFQYDHTDTTSSDNGGTIIVGADGRRWKRDYSGDVNVKWFGAMGDNINDDSEPTSRAIAYLFSINANTLFYPDGGTYLFKAPVTVVFDTFRSLRLLGTSTAGFTSIRPGGSRITGNVGIESLFIFTKTNPATYGGYAFEAENLDFDGKAFGVGSAFLNKVGGGPARPFNVNGCNFAGFQKAIYSDISSTGLTTGICQVNITGSSFVGNQYAVYGKGQGAIMDLRFVGNVCEQNSLGGIFTENLGILGTVDISDNLLEGQPNAIVLNCGLTAMTIRRNYFELNTSDLINIVSNFSGSVVEVGPNYYQNCSGSSVYLRAGRVNCTDLFVPLGINLDAAPLHPGSAINNIGQIAPRNWAAGITSPFDISCTELQSSVAPGVIDSGSYIDFSLGPVASPLGDVNYAAVAGAGPLKLTAATLAAGDAIVAVCLARVVSGTPNISLYVYDNASNSLANTPAAGPFTNRIQLGEWFLLAASAKVASSSGAGACRVRWLTSGGTIDVTKTYTYKISAPTDKSTPLYLYLPSFSPLYGSATYDPQSLNDGAGITTSVTVTGAALGDFVEAISFSNDLQGVTVTGWVSSANIVSIRFQNETGATVDLASGTIRAVVKKT